MLGVGDGRKGRNKADYKKVAQGDLTDDRIVLCFDVILVIQICRCDKMIELYTHTVPTSISQFRHCIMHTKSLQLCLTLCHPMDVAHQAPLFMGFSGKNIGVGYHVLLLGIFLTQGSNPHLLCLLQVGLLPLVPPGGRLLYHTDMKYNHLGN